MQFAYSGSKNNQKLKLPKYILQELLICNQPHQFPSQCSLFNFTNTIPAVPSQSEHSKYAKP